MSWKPFAIAGGAIAALVVGVGLGVGWSTGWRFGRTPAAAAKPEPDWSDMPRNLPEDAFPAVDDSGAPEKIKAAREAYDRELAELTTRSADLRTEFEMKSARVESLKRAQDRAIQAEVLPTEKPDVPPEAEPEDAPVGKGSRDLPEHLGRLLRDAIREKEEARSRLEEAERRLQALQSRPRPSERVEARVGDRIRVEVLEALPGRPITGERLVYPDGKVSLDFYGDLYVAGMTTDEIKEKVILRLRKFIPDATLGLVEFDAEKRKVEVIQPRDSDRVFVEITDADYDHPQRPARRDGRSRSGAPEP